MTEGRPPSSKVEDAEFVTPSERRRREIGARLRGLRREAGLTQVDLSERLGVTQSMVSRVELGDKSAGSLLLRIADALALPPEIRDELVDLQTELEIQVATLRVQHRRGGSGGVQADIGAHERAAVETWNYQPALVQGLLQTADYTRAILPKIAPHLPDVEALVAGRAARQRVLYDASKRFRFLLHESALRNRVAPVPVLRAQIDRLSHLAGALANVEIRVLSAAAKVDRWPMTGFAIIDDAVEVEWQLGTMGPLRDGHHVGAYRDLFENLWAHASSGDALLAVLGDVDSWLAELPE